MLTYTRTEAITNGLLLTYIRTNAFMVLSNTQLFIRSNPSLSEG
jgi:hypothetical protein